jgi:hypothetical protein
MMVPTTLTSPYPHPALRATFSQWEKGFKATITALRSA